VEEVRLVLEIVVAVPLLLTVQIQSFQALPQQEVVLEVAR
jgi:hypothetical protein